MSYQEWLVGLVAFVTLGGWVWKHVVKVWAWIY